MAELDGRTLTPGLDVIILAGGRGTRMGGRDKAAVVVDGERLVDLLLDEVSLINDLMQVVVVSTRDLEVRPGVKIAREEPPFSGPLSAIAAGLDSLSCEPSERTAILAVDAPDSAQLIPELRDALSGAPDSAAAVIEEAGGHLQPLCALWDTAALHHALRDFGDVSDRPAKALLETVSFVSVEGTGEERDYDTLEELAEFGDVED
ncbi:molybdenum cofactor guanylyltransferase [Corynebacterium guangdongense]|uniref:Molybdopterin-guanine dinucleotide biosynthesis protein A n=1 Tax=Corynebacterium guangdongense TaxID=1783348 RepID=A0ABU1ZYZ8_9CORY|nr:NTP transferase domain-containing protein [Corynebacterium guangdongense]MDR7329103.1 molybdopterin-guanine dinucleotide biosynthesis protein A [Corynebacterium guangdongense]WJZ17672.1 molybdopterin-guanine dinucleotide biosynthesis protein MobA [Corynebacterium guangdongense]